MTIWLVLLMSALVMCAFIIKRSKRPIANDVSLLVLALIPPMLGNLLIIVYSDWLIANIGCYIYFIGLDLAVIALLRFSADYCAINYRKSIVRKIVLAIVAVDIIQLLLNPITGHAFTTTAIIVEDLPYYSLVPFAGQAFHRVVAYGIFFCSIGIFVYKTITCHRLYRERYLVILVCMVLTGLLETYYIFSGSPIDRSMIAFGFFGLLVTYFGAFYRPMRLLDRMLSRVVSNMHDAVLFFDTDGRCIYGNEVACDFIGVKYNEDMPADAGKRVSDKIGGWGHKFNEDWTEMRVINENDEERFYVVNATHILDEDGNPMGSSVSVRDTTQEEKNLRREKYLAAHDSLTGLLNKEHLYEEARKLIDSNPEKNFCVVAFDVKDFKIVNDIFSKEFGDNVLIAIAKKIKENATEHFVGGRLSSDRFACFIAEDEFDLERIAGLLNSNLHEEQGLNYRVVIHMGIYRVSSSDRMVSVMVDRAFMAIASIKHDYQRVYAYYDEEMRNDVIWSQKISTQLETAIQKGQIRPYLQPMVDESGKIEGAEVLVRWIHPDEGFLSPARFIPVFEDNGMIARLDQHMWECACRILKGWEERGIDLFLSVNISPKDFYFIDVYSVIKDLVNQYGINPSKLRLEITETVMMSDLENRLRIIEALRDDGFLVEMDDFGSGYSSLNMLKDIPVDILKIDMMFLYKTKDTTKAQTILQTIINLSGELGMPAVTEGVETVDQYQMLVKMGCRMFQGYYFAKPMPLEDFEESIIAA